ncbi:gp53-like domain-containing protein, partial [Escherichia coli]
MHRIDTKTAQKDKFGAGKNGFTRGNPQTGTPATDLDDDYFDMLQEELCSVVEASGASLEKGRHDQLLTALRALLLSRKNPFGDIKSDGTVKTALENLGLGEAAKRDVGTGENQIPDMSAWKRNPSSNRWRKLPDGTIIQMGISASGPLGSPVNITLPISFSNTNYCVVASYDNARSGVSTMVSFAALPVSPSQFSLMS